MKVHLEARRIDRLEVTLTPAFESEQEWRAHAISTQQQPPGAEAELLPETVMLTWTRCTHTGGYRWRPLVRVDGYAVTPGVADTVDFPRRGTTFHDVADAPEWLRQLVAKHDPVNPASPLRYLGGLGDLG